MSGRSPHLEDPEAIRMALQRVCREGGGLWLRFEKFEREFPILAEDGERIVVGITAVERGQWGLKPGVKLLLRLTDRGRVFEAVTAFGGHGRLEGEECGDLEIPRMFKCMDEHRFADWQPPRPLACTYTTPSMDIKDGLLRALGHDGVELELKGAQARNGEVLRQGGDSVVGFTAEDLKVVLQATVAHFGEGYAGLRIKEGADPPMVSSYRAWLQDRIRDQMRRDREGFEPGGAQAPRGGAEVDQKSLVSVHQWVDRDPLVLVIAEGEELPARLAQSLGRKFGFASIDYVQGLIHPRLGPLGAGLEDWGRVRLLLVHQRLRVSSGLELTRQLIQEERCPLPVLVAGTEEDVSLKRNRAIAAGAIDFISVEPFHVLALMRTLEETLRMFA